MTNPPLPPDRTFASPAFLQAIRTYSLARMEIRREEAKTAAALSRVLRSDWRKRADVQKLHARQTERGLAEAVLAQAREAIFRLIDKALDGAAVGDATSAFPMPEKPGAAPDVTAEPSPPPYFDIVALRPGDPASIAAARAHVAAAMIANPLEIDNLEDASLP